MTARFANRRPRGNSPSKVTDLRILSGRYRGTILGSPRSTQTHPMGAREKNALFNMLQPYLPGARVLDLFAGSGALGIEALSRGAAEVIFVEKSPQIARILEQNLARLSPAPNRGQTKVFAQTALKFAQTASYEAQFDLILVDPPYDGFLSQKPLRAHANSLSGPNRGTFTTKNPICQHILAKSSDESDNVSRPNLDNLQLEPELLALFKQISPLLTPDGHLVLSSPAALPPLEVPNLTIISTHTYARARLTLYAQV